MPSLSHAALSHISDRAKKPPASQPALLLAPSGARRPVQKSDVTQTAAQDTEAMSSWCCTGACTSAVAARATKSSGTRMWWFLRACSAAEEAAASIDVESLAVRVAVGVHVRVHASRSDWIRLVNNEITGGRRETPKQASLHASPWRRAARRRVYGTLATRFSTQATIIIPPSHTQRAVTASPTGA
jgi:hypothetical protein